MRDKNNTKAIIIAIRKGQRIINDLQKDLDNRKQEIRGSSNTSWVQEFLTN
jgi:hypothetical protein